MCIDEIEYNLNVEKTKQRITSLYYQTSGNCYLSFSGGKDSMIILSLIKALGLNIPAVFCDTQIELDATYSFVKWINENYYPITIIKPEKNFSQVLKENGKPIKSKMKSNSLRVYQKNPNSKTAQCLINGKTKKLLLGNKDFHLLHPNFNIKIANSCCDYLKKKPFKKYILENNFTGQFTGERIAEGGAREYNAEQRVKSGKPICTKINGDVITKSPIIDWSDEMVEMFRERESTAFRSLHKIW